MNYLDGTDSMKFRKSGCGERAYLRTMQSQDARQYIEDMPEMPDGLILYIVFNSDGTPFAFGENWGVVMTMADDDHLEIIRAH